MTEAYLGPVKLDANGEASGEGWRVRHDGRGSLCLDIGTCYFGASPEDLENTINIYVSPGNRCENASLVEWARQVGWPGYETEHLTCGPLRLERLRDPSNRRMDCWQWESCQFFVRIWTSGDGFFCKTGKTSSEIMLPYAAGRSPTEAAQALAAAIEASTDPAVVRFRAEHWVRGEYEVTLLEPPTKPSLDLNAHAKEWAKYWDRGAAFAHWSGKLTKAQHDEWLELVVADDSVPTALCALVAELMARWDYPPGEALRRARYLVARTLEPLALLVDTPEEQVARCRASVEGETLGVEAAGTATPSPPSPFCFFARQSSQIRLRRVPMSLFPLHVYRSGYTFQVSQGSGEERQTTMTTITKTIDGITYTATVSEGRVTIQADGMGATEGDWDADAGRIDNAPGALCADPDDTEAVYSALETALVQAGA